MAEPSDPIAAWLAGELSHDDVDGFQTWLRADPARQERLVREARFAVALGEEVRARLARREAGVTTRRRRLAPRPRPWARVGLAAAVLALVAVSAWWLHRPQSRITWAGDGSRIGTAPARIDARVADSTRLRGPLTLRLDDGSLLDLAADGELVLLSGRSHRLHLDRGHVNATVAPQRTGRLAIGTAEAEAAVVGTRFTLAAEPGATRLVVAEGLVRFRHRLGAVREVGAGDSAWADGAGLRGRILEVAPADARPAPDDSVLADLQSAADQARPGDLIRLLPGTHTRGDATLATLRCRGTAEQPIVVTADAQARITGSGWEILRCDGAHHLVLRDLRIERDPSADAGIGGHGIGLDHCRHVTIAGCRLVGLGGGGIVSERCDGLRIVRNQVTSCTHATRHGLGGITINTSFVAPGDAPAGILVAGNQVVGSRLNHPNQNGSGWNGGDGICVFNHAAGAEDPAYPGYAGTIEVSGNILVDNDGAGIRVFRGPPVRIAGNICHRNGGGRSYPADLVILLSPGSTITANLISSLPDHVPLHHDRPLRADRNLCWGGAGEAPPGFIPLTSPPWLTEIADEQQRTDFRLRDGLPPVLLPIPP